MLSRLSTNTKTQNEAMTSALHVRKSLEFRRKSWEVGGTFPEILVMTRWKSHAFDSQKVRRNNIGLKIVRRPRKTVPDFISVKTCNCLCNALILSSHSEERKFEIIGHLQIVHDTHEILSILLLRLRLKTHIWSHYTMKRVEQCYSRP